MLDDVARMVPVVFEELGGGRVELWLTDAKEADAVVKRLTP